MSLHCFLQQGIGTFFFAKKILVCSRCFLFSFVRGVVRRTAHLRWSCMPGLMLMSGAVRRSLLLFGDGDLSSFKIALKSTFLFRRKRRPGTEKQSHLTKCDGFSHYFFTSIRCFRKFEPITRSDPILIFAISGKLSMKEVTTKGKTKREKYLTPFQRVFLYEYFMLLERIFVGSDYHFSSPRDAL